MFVGAFDRKGRAIWYSHAMPSVDVADYLGRPAWEQVIPEDRDTIQATFGRALVSPAPVPFTCRVNVRGAPIEFRGSYHQPPKKIAILSTSTVSDPRISRLSPRELEVCRMLARYPVKKIARLLKIKPSTVESHRASAAGKIGLNGLPFLAWCLQQFKS